MKYCPECGYEPFYEPAIFCTVCATKLKDKDDVLSKDDTLSAEEFKMAMKPFEFERLSTGYNLTAIKNKLSTVASVPYGVTSIGNAVFKKCPNLTTVSLPRSLTAIGDQAFGWCKGKTSYDVYIEDLEFWCAIAFAAGSSNPLAYSKQFIVGGKATTELDIPDTVDALTDNVFYGFESLTRVKIPSTVRSIGEFAFAYCYGLTEVTLPESVDTLGVGVFYNCKSLAEVKINGPVESLEKWVFSTCKSLKRIYLPASICLIGKEAFKDCTALTDIYFAGSKKDWKSVQIDKDTNPVLKKAKLHFDIKF